LTVPLHQTSQNLTELATPTLSTTPLSDPTRLFSGIDPALFLDIDGTLIELAATPDAVVIGTEVPDILLHLHRRLGGAIALVSGRRLQDIDRLFGTLPLVAAGQHGLERRDEQGTVTRHSVDRELMAKIAEKFDEFVRRHPGMQVEDKGLTVALHYRNAPAVKDAARRFVEQTLQGLGSGMSMHDGNMVLEVKPQGVDKGTAVLDMMGQPPFAGRTPIFIGDDVTDEDGFRAVNELGGMSIEVGHREPTLAQYRITDVSGSLALLTWLAKSDTLFEAMGSTV